MATRQTLQLEELSYEYELFRENQLLTHEQLNKFIRYFEDQDRLTRTCLIGVGLVCGLSAKFKSNVLTVSQGCAVTTDGDLLKLETTDYKYFREYSNLTRGKGDPIYDPFFPPGLGGKQVKLWEMMETDKVDTGDKPAGLATFKTASGSNVEDMVAMLYLEYYLSEPDDCTAIDCDHLGQLQHARIKVLLLSQEDMDKVINSEPTEIIADHIYKGYYEAYTKYFELPELKARRLPMSSLNTASLGALTKGYTSLTNTGAAELASAVEDLYNTFQFILDPTRYFKITTIRNKLNTTLTASAKPYQVQYLYDFYKDILDCYNEIKDTIYNAIYICCPDKYAFPKHIMLGIVNGALGPRPPQYRHYFYPSPAVSKNRSYLSVARTMFNRLVDMCNGFSMPEQPADIRVTPSVNPDKQLEWRAIPFYYKNAATLRERWSYYRTMRGTEGNILSYYGLDYGKNDMTRNPLDYDIDKNNFFRIEGHMGKKVSEAMETILDIREKKSLPFDVVALRMDPKQQMTINPDDFTCQFEDLNAVLNAWIVEQDCLYAKSVKFFSAFDNTGTNRQPVKTGGIKFTRDTAAALLPEKERAGLTAMRSSETVAGRSTATDTSTGTAKYSYLPKYGNTYQVDNTVNESLFLEEDTVGNTYLSLTGANTFMLADAYIGMFLQFADQNPKLQLLTADQREIVYNIPVKLIARINEVTRFKPFEIKDLSTETLDAYKKAIEALCDEAEASRVKAEAIFAKTSWVKQGYEAQYRNALVELTENCCAADKLNVLMEEIEARKKTILESLSFANYAAQHPGLEHKAGVHRGGTFVLLYAVVEGKSIPGRTQDSLRRLLTGNDTGKRTALKEERDISSFFEADEDTFLLELVSRKNEVDVTAVIRKYLETNGYSLDTLKGKVKYKAMLEKAEAFAASLAAEQETSLSNEMVVADFCIPYICCSDCPPLVFVMPKQRYSLALPKTVACSDETPLLFQREPADGTVAAAPGFEQTVVEKDGATFFDPGAVAEADFGKEITFTIDGQVTDCRIRVEKHPEAKFSFKVTEETADIIVVTFTNESDDASGKQYEYEWNFGDGRAIQKATTKDPITITYKKSGFGSAKSFKVTLKATNGGCNGTAVQAVPLAEIPEEVGLTPEKAQVCDTDSAVGFAVIPEKGVVACKEVPAAVSLQNGKYVFSPGTVPAASRNKALHFTVNGQDVPATITVFPKADAAFSVDTTTVVRNGDLLDFSIIVKTIDADSYQLEGPSGVIAKDLKPSTKGVIVISGMKVTGMAGKITLTLSVSRKDGPCGVSSGTAILDIPVVPQVRCSDLVAEFISKARAELTKLQGVLKNQDLVFINQFYLDNVYKTAADNVSKLNDNNVQRSLYNMIREVFPSLLRLQLDTATDKEQGSMILRYILMMTMNIVRCDTLIEADVEKQHNDIIDLFTQAVRNVSLAKFFTTLDQNDELTAFIKGFLNDFNGGASIPDTLKALLIVLANSF